MNLTISDRFDRLVKDKEIQFDQKQYELIKALEEKCEEFIDYTQQSLLKKSLTKKSIDHMACIYMVTLAEVSP